MNGYDDQLGTNPYKNTVTTLGCGILFWCLFIFGIIFISICLIIFVLFKINIPKSGGSHAQDDWRTSRTVFYEPAI